VGRGRLIWGVCALYVVLHRTGIEYNVTHCMCTEPVPEVMREKMSSAIDVGGGGVFAC
jgi:hypothetical protein